jgi:hypothetical protein
MRTAYRSAGEINKLKQIKKRLNAKKGFSFNKTTIRPYGIGLISLERWKNMKKSMSMWIVGLCIVGISSAAVAQDVAAPTTNSVIETATQEPFPFHFDITLSTSAGSGFFSNPWNPTFGNSLNLNPSWDLSKNWRLSLSQDAEIEWTDGDGVAFARQPGIADTVLGLSYSGKQLREKGFTWGVTTSYRAPVSLSSRNVGSLGAIGLRLNTKFAHNDSGIGLRLFGLGGLSIINPELSQRYADVEASPYVDRTYGSITPRSCITRGDNDLAGFACGTIPRIGNYRVGVGFDWQPKDSPWSAGIDLSFGQAFSYYNSPNDALKAENAVAGIGSRESTSGDIHVGYSVTDWLSLSLGAASSQPLMNAAYTAPRFPLWDFVTPYNNFSSIYFDIGISL